MTNNQSPAQGEREKLAACPFCGGEAELLNWDFPYKRFQVRCSQCKATASGRRANDPQAITAWNTRASHPPAVDADVVEAAIGPSLARSWGIEQTSETLWIGPMRRDDLKVDDIAFSLAYGRDFTRAANIRTLALAERLVALWNASLSPHQGQEARLLREARDALETFGKDETLEQLYEDDEEWAKFRFLVKDYRRAGRALKAIDAHLSGQQTPPVDDGLVEEPVAWRARVTRWNGGHGKWQVSDRPISCEPATRSKHGIECEPLYAALRTTDSNSAGVADVLPRLDAGLIEAAMIGHYGARSKEHTIDGVALTAHNVNWSFREGFKRMWGGVRKELARRAALTNPASKETGDEG